MANVPAVASPGARGARCGWAPLPSRQFSCCHTEVKHVMASAGVAKPRRCLCLRVCGATRVRWQEDARALGRQARGFHGHVCPSLVCDPGQSGTRHLVPLALLPWSEWDLAPSCPRHAGRSCAVRAVSPRAPQLGGGPRSEHASAATRPQASSPTNPIALGFNIFLDGVSQ